MHTSTYYFEYRMSRKVEYVGHNFGAVNRNPVAIKYEELGENVHELCRKYYFFFRFFFLH